MRLRSGATLVIGAAGSRRSHALARLICEQDVTHATLPPVLLARRCPRIVPLQTLIVARRSLSPRRCVRAGRRGRRMINAYGPTETTVCATHELRRLTGA